MKLWALICAALVAGPAFGFDSTSVDGVSFSPPERCDAFLTVQRNDCRVAHFWNCEDDPTGHNWSRQFDESGRVSTVLTDKEFRTLVYRDHRQGISETLLPPDADSFSLSELISSGNDSFDFRTDYRDNDVLVDYSNYSGFQRLTGETTEVGDEVLLLGEFQSSLKDDQGRVLNNVSGSIFVSEHHRTVFVGKMTATFADGESVDIDATPVALFRPGDAGFLSNTPLFGCNDSASREEATPSNDKDG